MNNPAHNFIIQKDFVCPYGRMAILKKEARIVPYSFFVDTHGKPNTDLIEQLSAFAINESEPCLIMTLPLQLSNMTQATIEDVNALQNNLATLLADMCAGIMMNKTGTIADVIDASKHFYPRMGFFGVGMEGRVNDYESYKNSFFNTYKNSERGSGLIIDLPTRSVVANFMGPIYDTTHPRFSPVPMIILVDNDILTGLGDKRESVSKHIYNLFKEQGSGYDIGFFSNPIPALRNSLNERAEKINHSIFAMMNDIFKDDDLFK